jgi:hypothetical protein
LFLLLDDEEEAFHLGLVLQDFVWRLFDDVFAGGDAAPGIGANGADGLIDAESEGFVLLEVVVKRLEAGRGERGGRVLGSRRPAGSMA